MKRLLLSVVLMQFLGCTIYPLKYEGTCTVCIRDSDCDVTCGKKMSEQTAMAISSRTKNSWVECYYNQEIIKFKVTNSK